MRHLRSERQVQLVCQPGTFAQEMERAAGGRNGKDLDNFDGQRFGKTTTRLLLRLEAGVE
jgi:hypothetical protein